MPALLDCPEAGCWQGLLSGTLPPDRREDYERHLEDCPACQDRLHRSIDCGSDLVRLAREVGDPVPPGPTLRTVLERLYEESHHDTGTPTALYFLRPSEDPTLLGTLGQYAVSEVIGRGGMGVVLKAHDPTLGRLVAVKVLSPLLAGSADARKRFTREARAAASVNHENVIVVHGVEEADGLPYLVMQFVQGESLQGRLDRDGPRPVPEVLRIGLETARGLAAAHAQGLIHRDIKPANILLEGKAGRVKITDFGLARAVDDIGLTRDGVIAGTPQYMAPEQARGLAVDHRSDLFSLGAVIYAMCSGEAPFQGENTLAVLRQVYEKTPPPLRERNPEAPAWLEAFVARLMEKDPAHRFQSAGEVAGLIEDYLAHLSQPQSIHVPSLPSLPRERRSGRGRTLQWLAGGVILPAMVLMAALLPKLARRVPAAGEKQARPVEFHHDFRGKGRESEVLHPFGEGVRFDEKGARVSLPGGQGKLPHTGFRPTFSVKGDFEATFAFEILKADRPAEGYGVGVSIYARIDPNENNAVSLARRVMRDGKAVFSSNRMKPVDGKLTHQVKSVPSTAAAGKLRLQRVGSKARFFVADGPDAEFVLMREAEFGTADVEPLQIGGDAGGSESALDFRVLSLTVRADDLPGWQAQRVAVTNAEPPPPPAGGGMGWLAAALLVGLGVTLAAVALGGWAYYRVRGRPNPTVPAGAPSLLVAFSCPGCHKTFKVKAELAGRKGKCPGCGQAITVPANEAITDRPESAAKPNTLPEEVQSNGLASRPTPTRDRHG